MNSVWGSGFLNWRAFLVSAGLGVCLTGMVGGCAARLGRDYGHPVFPAAEYYQIQRVWSGEERGLLFIERLLVLPPRGDVPPVLAEVFLHSLRQELQQILPGVVQVPESRGGYASYLTEANLLYDSGWPSAEELARMGGMAGASHVLFVRLLDFRPYPPQRILMEWTLVDVEAEAERLLLVGGMDASEQVVLVAADRFLRERRALPYTTENLELLLRSPREYSSFAVSQAVNALKGYVVVATLSEKALKDSGETDDNSPREVEL